MALSFLVKTSYLCVFIYICIAYHISCCRLSTFLFPASLSPFVHVLVHPASFVSHSSSTFPLPFSPSHHCSLPRPPSPSPLEMLHEYIAVGSETQPMPAPTLARQPLIFCSKNSSNLSIQVTAYPTVRTQDSMSTYANSYQSRINWVCLETEAPIS